jgi:hypothetical protein
MTDKIHYPILFGVSPRKRNTFLIKIFLEIQGKEIFLDALLDSGASDNFLEKSKYGLKTKIFYSC